LRYSGLALADRRGHSPDQAPDRTGRHPNSNTV
jgi:hypothetical protein